MDLIELQKKNITIYDELLGEKNATIHSIEISDIGVRIYALSFGANQWLRLEDIGKTWDIAYAKQSYVNWNEI